MTNDRIQDWPNDRKAAAAAGVAVVVGSFGPWINASSGLFSISASGMDNSDGKATAVLGGLIVLFVFAQKWTGAIIAGALVLVIGVIDYNNVTDIINEAKADGVVGSVGWGLYAVLGGGIFAAITSFEHRRRLAAAASTAALESLSFAPPSPRPSVAQVLADEPTDQPT